MRNMRGVLGVLLGNTKVPLTYIPRKHLIASRRMASVINNWAQGYTSTPVDVVNSESHDQKKSRLIKQHKDAMDRAFGGKP